MHTLSSITDITARLLGTSFQSAQATESGL